MNFLILFIEVLWGFTAFTYIIENIDDIKALNSIIDKAIVIMIFIIGAPVILVSSALMTILEEIFPDDWIGF